MTPEQANGLRLLLICCGAPLLTGAALGWWLRGRFDRFGFPGALLPGFVREWLAE